MTYTLILTSEKKTLKKKDAPKPLSREDQRNFILVKR